MTECPQYPEDDREESSSDVGPDQSLLFDGADEAEWRREWVGMPEFIQEQEREYAKLIVRFRSQADLDEFARIIGQRLNRKSQCTWYPEFQKSESRHRGKVYTDEA